MTCMTFSALAGLWFIRTPRSRYVITADSTATGLPDVTIDVSSG